MNSYFAISHVEHAGLKHLRTHSSMVSKSSSYCMSFITKEIFTFMFNRCGRQSKFGQFKNIWLSSPTQISQID